MRALLLSVIFLAFYPAYAIEEIDFSAILSSNKQAYKQQSAEMISTLDNVCSYMSTAKESMSTEYAATIDGVAAAMNSMINNTPAENFYNSDIHYSTYGLDTRAELSMRNATRNNPFHMGEYNVSTTYATPGGRKYIHLGKNNAVMPVSGYLTSNYGYRPQFGRMHNGVDISLREGDTVRAAYAGRVVLISNDPDGYGRYVKVKHQNGMETIYAHLNTPLVVSGQHLHAGEPLGLGGATGNATGAHLHFETRLNGIAVDPTAYFDFNRRQAKQNVQSPIQDDTQTTITHKKWETHKHTQNTRKHQPKIKTETISTANNSKSKIRTGTYRVRRGDTLAKIAREHNMTINEICRINKMSKYTPMYSGKIIRLK